MDKLENYRKIIREIIKRFAEIDKSSDDSAQTASVIDAQKDRYLLLTYGRENGKRVNSCWLHVEIRNGKFWIHYDGTEDGVASYLLEKGVPKSDIVLAFYSPEKRKLTDFAIA
jgi:hypothetical protein